MIFRESMLNAVIDIPLAIPTLVTGVMLVILYGPQEALGGWLEHTLGWRIIFAPPGIILALLFVRFLLWCGLCSRCCSVSTAPWKTPRQP